MAVPILDWPTDKYLHCPAIPGIKYEIKNIIKNVHRNNTVKISR